LKAKEVCSDVEEIKSGEGEGTKLWSKCCLERLNQQCNQ